MVLIRQAPKGMIGPRLQGGLPPEDMEAAYRAEHAAGAKKKIDMEVEKRPETVVTQRIVDGWHANISYCRWAANRTARRLVESRMQELVSDLSMLIGMAENAYHIKQYFIPMYVELVQAIVPEMSKPQPLRGRIAQVNASLNEAGL